MTFTPAIAPSQDTRCALCGTYQSVMPGHEEHHWIPRSLGGTDVITLCIRCHNATEGYQPWKVGVTDDYVFAYDAAGKLIVKRWFAPAGFDEGLFIQQLEDKPAQLRRAAISFRFLSDEALKTAANVLENVSDVTWYCLAHLFREAMLRTPYGNKTEKLEGIAQAFDLKKRAAYKYIAALEVVEEHPELVHDYAQLPSPDALLLIKTAGDVEAAIDLYQDRVTANPNYSATSFREELKRGATSLDEPPQHHQCPSCGQWHLLKEAQ